MAFVPSTFGAPGGGLPDNPYQVGSSKPPGILQVQQPGQTPQQKKEEEQNLNLKQAYDTYQKFAGQGTTSLGTGGSTGGSSLVTGGIGNASYAPTGFGLQGASTGLTYGGGLGTSLGASSGLIGSAGGATAGASTGGASFGLGGSLVGGTGTVGGSTFAAGAGGSAAGGGAAAGGSAAGGGLAAAGPWAALIAAIGLNENYQKKSGNRDQGTYKQIEHAITGKVVEDDASVWGEKIDKGNKLGIKGDMEVGADFATFDFKNAFKNLDQTFGVKTIKKLFGG